MGLTLVEAVKGIEPSSEVWRLLGRTYFELASIVIPRRFQDPSLNDMFRRVGTYKWFLFKM